MSHTDQLQLILANPPSKLDPPKEILEAAKQYAETGTVAIELMEKILGPTHKSVAILPKEHM